MVIPQTANYLTWSIELTSLTVPERTSLAALEETIERGFETFVEVGQALMVIHENKLYREGFENFNDYCKERWGWTRQHAHRLMSAAETVSKLKANPAVEELPKNERQARPLKKLHPDDRAEAWLEAVEESEGHVTQDKVAEVVARKLPTVGMDGPADWYTPDKYIDLVKEVLGDIDLDPASCSEANTKVGAHVYYSIAQGRNGLREPWPGRVYLNPPYGRKVIQEWIAKAMAEFDRGTTEEMIVCINNATDTQWFAELWDGSLCFVQGRIKFWGPHNKTDSPAHGTVFAYFGAHAERFAEVFSKIGCVIAHAGNSDREIHFKR